jgi:hypothetical protein
MSLEVGVVVSVVFERPERESHRAVIAMLDPLYVVDDHAIVVHRHPLPDARDALIRPIDFSMPRRLPRESEFQCQLHAQ